MKKVLLLLVALVIAGVSYAQLTGTKTIPGDYATITAAVTDLNTVGVGSGGVTFNVAAGYTETITAPISVTATGTATDQIIFQKSGTGANPLITAYVGTATPSTAVTDGMWNLVGSDYVTIDGIDLYDPNTTNPATMEYGYAMFKGAVDNGCQYNTIKNCVVTLSRVNNASGSGPSTEGSKAINVVNALVTTQTTAVTPTTAAGTNSYNKFYGNTLQNCNYGIVLYGYAAATPFTLGDTGNDVGGTSSTTGNNILNYGGATSATNPAAGVRANYEWGVNISYNTINNNNGSGVNHVSTLRGIYAQAGTSANATINHNAISLYGGGTTSQLSGIENAIGSTAASNTVDISYNTVTGNYLTATSGTFYAIYNSASAATVNLTFNTVNGITHAGTGTLYGIYGSSPTNLNIYNNAIYNNNKTSTGSLYGMYCGTAIISMHDNNIYNNTITQTGTSTSTCNIYGYYDASSPTVETYYNNQIHDLSITGTTTGNGNIYGIYTYTVSTDARTWYNNEIYNFSAATGGSSTMYGFYCQAGGTGNLYKNKIYNFNASGASSVLYGININSGTTYNIYNNFISDLKTPTANAAIPLAGIYIGGGTTSNILYNTVYLSGTSSGALFGSTAVYASTTPTVDMRDNILVNNCTPVGATGYVTAYRRSSTTLTTYASASNFNCFYAGIPGTNNLIMYDGTNSYQDMASYKTAVAPRDAMSFRELPPFVGGSPYDLHLQTTIATQCESGGTPISTPIAITDDFDGNTRNATTPDVGADEGGFTPLDLNPPSISYSPLGVTSSLTARTLNVTVTDPSGVPTTSPGWPNLYWKINYTGTYAAATPTGVAGSVYTYNFGSGVVLGDTVYYYVVAQDGASTPNVGAYPSAGAGNFTINPPAAGTPPTSPSKYVIVGLPLSGDYTVGTAKFNQVTGHNIYFEQVVQKVIKEVDVTVPSTTEPEKGKEAGDIAALDLNQGVKEIREVEEVHWVPMENGALYTGDLYIKASEHPEVDFPDGTKGVYATITAAVTDLNLRGVSGPVRFLLTDASYSTGETYPLTVYIVNEALPTATNTVTFKPNTGVTATITGATAQNVFGIYDNYVTIDGSNTVGGTTRDLTIVNTYTGGSYNLVIVLWNGSGKVATNTTVKNCIIEGTPTTTSSYGLFLNASGGAYHNTSLINNKIQNVKIGIQFVGVSGSITNNGLISGNVIGDATKPVKAGGILMSNADNTVVSNNEIFGEVAGNTNNSQYGISLGVNSTNTKIRKNKIHDFYYTGTSGYGCFGIRFGGEATSVTEISNNFIYAIKADGDATGLSYTPSGIYVVSGGNIAAYFNSINMTGNTLGQGTSYNGRSACISVAAGVTLLDIRDNILVNSMGSFPGSTKTNNTYAVYSESANTAYSAINYNDYFVNGVNPNIGYLGAAQADLAAWQTATAQDANSVSVDPKFQSTSDLHIVTSYANVSNIGQPLAAVTTDIDGDSRSLTTPDLGADEYTYVIPTVDPPVAFSAAAASSTQIDLTFTPNAVPNNVVIVWNLTGTFTDPTGTPTLNGSLAGGTVLYIGTTSPVNHSGLPVSTHYFYKAFSYDGTNYSSGLTADATTLTPVLTVAPTSLAFGYVAYPGTSAEQTYALSGTNLAGTGNITVTAPAAFEVSLSTGTGFGSSVLVPFTGPTLAATTIYVRFVPAAPTMAYSGNITNDGGSAVVKNVAVNGSSDLFASYCPSSATSAADEDIFNVTVGTLNNTSDCSTTGGTGSVLNMYSNYLGLTPPDLAQGTSVAFSLTSGTCGGNYNNCFKIFIDYNQDGDFADAGEGVYVTPTPTTSGPHTETGNFTVPAGATLGNTMMRVINRETSDPSLITACGTYSWGETEDYSVNITAATTPSMSAVPNSISFGYVPVGGTSAPQSYVLTGLALSPASGDIVVTAPSMFQVSLTSGSGYASSINVPYTGGAVNATVYAVFAPTVAGTYSSDITNIGGGASAPVAVSGTTNVVYCSAGSSDCDEYISRVQLNTIDNSTLCSTGGYADYSAQSTQLTKGSAYTATITNGLPYSGDQCGVWIDWNNNGSFYDAGETMTVSGGPSVYTASITPPFGALETSVRMRVRICYTSGLDPCGTASYGEVEDYTVTVMPALAHDVGVVSIDNMTSPIASGTVVTPKATIANYGTNTETFTVTMACTPGTYTSTQTVTALAPGATVQLTFANWTAEAGAYVFEATAELESDLNSDNNKKSFDLGVFEAGNGVWTSGAATTTTSYLGTGVGYVDNSVVPPVGYLFTIGGNTTSGLGTECYKYNESTNTWTAIAPLPEGRRVLASARVGNFIYAFGGSNMSSVYQSTVYKYDITLDTWTTVASLPLTIGWGKAVSYGTDIYLAGGYDGVSAYLSSVYRYNTLTDTWTTATSMPDARIGGAFSIAGSTLVYVGGAYNDVTNTVFVGAITAPDVIAWTTAKSVYPGNGVIAEPSNLNPAALDVTQTGTIPLTKSNYPGGVMYRFDAAPWGDDGIIVTTGSPTTDWVPADPNPCFVYKPATDSWIVEPNLPIPVLGSYLGSIDILETTKTPGNHRRVLMVASGLSASASSTAMQKLTEIFAPPTKTLNLKLYIEGFVKAREGVPPAAGFMYKAQLSDGSITSDAFSGTIVDTLTVALASGTSPYGYVYYAHNVSLNTDGTLIVSVPSTYSGNYYIAIKHRQSIETWSATAVSFSGSTISYDFSTAASQAYGNNQANLGSNWGFGLFDGDIVKDGYIELNEVNATYTAARNAQYSYVVYDFTGNGFVELDDVNLIYTNYRNGKSFLWPGAVK